jgi:tetratricopeptide (TPR) repeat protein
MARIVFTTTFVVSLIVLFGCQNEIDRGLRMPVQAGTSRGGSFEPVNLAEVTEVDLVEQMATNRQAYRRGLELLIQYYTRTGNNDKMKRAERELAAFDTMPRYIYITEADVLPENLRATTLIAEADVLFEEAMQLEKQAGPLGPLPIPKNENTLRLALDKYTQLMKKYPSSDKIDDAAFQAAGIFEYFRDYSTALTYYQRAYQWDPETPNPVRFKAASILDRHLLRRSEALELYREAIREEGEFEQWKSFAEKRIMELTKSEVAPR